MDKSQMNILSRRHDDTREKWGDDGLSKDEALIIPPCDLWHVADHKTTSVKTESPDNDKSTQIETVLKNTVNPTSQCWAFMGAVGGVGTTTLAVQMAHELAKLHKDTFKRYRRAEPQICLIDLDFESGSCKHHLDVEPSLSIDDLTSDAIRIDTTLAQALFSTHSSGISVLAAPNLIGANARVKPETVLALLDAACEMFPYVILDLPRNWQSWSHAALAGSDFVGLLSDLTIPSLHMARTKRNQLAKMFEGEVSCQIILNKYERRFFNNALKLSDAQLALQRDIFGTICVDRDVTREALNCGEPVGAIRSDSRYVKDSRRLLHKIIEMSKLNIQNIPNTAHIAA